MRKRFTSFASRLTGLMSLLTFLCLTAFSAKAEVVDLGELELGVKYDLPMYKDYVATFTAPSTGTVKCENVPTSCRWFSDAAYASVIEGKWSNYGDYGDHAEYTSYAVEEGVTYYIRQNFNMNSSWLRLEMEAENLEMTKVTPEEGSVISPTGYAFVNIYMSSDFIISGVKLVSGTSSVSIPARMVGRALMVDYGSAMLDWFNTGVLKGGENIQIVISGLKKTDDGSLYGGDGVLTLNYVASEKPVILLNYVVPNALKSYYAPGDPAGILKFTFSDELAPVSENGQAVLQYGTFEGEESEGYEEVIPMTIEGKVMSVDFTGKRRTPYDMVPSGTNYNNPTLRLLGIKDANGSLVASEGQGTLGSYSFAMSLDVIAKANVLSEFTPANGSSLTGDNVEVWISGVNVLTFDGFRFTYLENGEEKYVVVPMSEVTVSGQTATDAVYTFAIPAEVKGKTGVVITPNNLVSADGYDHSDAVKATYDSFVITYADPANGTRMAALTSGQVITIETNYAERYPEMYMMWEVEDLNPDDPDEAIIKSQSWLNRQEDGSYTAEVYGNYKMLSGHTYRATFTAWENEMAKNYRNDPVGEATLLWEGSAEAFKFSNVNFVSITPDPETTTLAVTDNTFIVEFDGMVTLNADDTFINSGMGTKANFESITPVGGDPLVAEATYDYKWQLVVPESYMQALDASILLSIKARDMDGLIVAGNTGKEEQSYFAFTYEVAAAFRAVDVIPAPDSEVASLKEFEVSFSAGINRSYEGTEEPKLLTMQGGEVGKLTVVIPESTDDNIGSDITTLKLVLDEEVTEPGTYLLHIPKAYFALGSQFEAWKSEEVNARYFVVSSETPEDMKVTTDPAQGKVTELTQIGITFDEYDEVGLSSGKATLTINGGEPINLPDATWDWDAPAFNYMVQPLGQTYTEDGTYIISFPAGYFELGKDGDYNPSQAFSLTYTIGDVEELPAEEIMVMLVNADGEPVDGDVIESLSMLGAMTMNEAGFTRSTVPASEAVIYSMTQEEVAHVTNVYLNEYNGVAYDAMLELDNAVTEAGNYMLVIPEGFFLHGNGAKSARVEMFFSVIGAMTATTDPAEGQVKELNEITVNFSAPAGLGWASPYLTKDGEDVDVEINVDFADTDAASAGLAEAYVLTLSAPVTELGNYTLVLPMGAFVNAAGSYLPEFTFNYEVTGEDAPKIYTCDPAEGAVSELSEIELTFIYEMEVGAGSGRATLTVNGGEVVTLPDAGFGIDWNQMVQSLGQTYTELGTYVVSFPEGYFLFGADGDRLSPAFTLTYTIGQDGIVSVGADENGNFTVYNLAGVKVLVTDNEAEVKALTPGFYIVNNVKIYIH